MAEKRPTKAELLEEIRKLQGMVKELQDDLIAYSQGIVQVENQMDTMRQAFQESYNPYSKGPRFYPREAMETVRRLNDRQFAGFDRAVQFRDQLRQAEGNVSVNVKIKR